MLLAGRGALLLAVAAAAAAAVPPVASAAAPASCRTALSGTLASLDPTVLEDRPSSAVRVRAGSATDVRVTVTRDGRTVAGGTARRLRRGTTSVPLRLRRALGAGPLRVRVTGRVTGCGTTGATSRLRLRAGSLPVRAALRGATLDGGRSVVRVLVRTVGARTARDVRVGLLRPDGTVVASARLPGRLAGATEVVLRAGQPLPSGGYRLRLSGRPGRSRAAVRAEQPIELKKPKPDDSAATPDPARQRAVLDWSGASSAGRDVVGFVLPGVGHGELVCSATTQWVRVFPTDLRRETSMLTWTYRSWDGDGTFAEKALREALLTTGTGRDFNEGFNKFQPAEKRSTGEFIALVSDRGPAGASFAPSLAPPVGLRVTWEWDFRDPSRSRCHAEADVVAQTAGAQGVGSAQVLWRGDAAAAGRDVAVADLPGVGRLQLTCQATPSGTRSLRLDGASGATVTTREGSVDVAVPHAPGPVLAELPNNGQLQIDTPGGRVLISSRWKVNDPDPAQNSCAVAAQSVAP